MHFEKYDCQQLLNNLSHQKDTFVHKFIHKGEDIYLIHKLQRDQYRPKSLIRGQISIIYKYLSDINQNIMEYKAVRNKDSLSFIEIESIRLPEDYRRIGLGSIVLQYLELKIAKELYPDIKCIKGITIVGDFDLKKFYQKNGYVFNNFAITKKINV